MPVDRDPVRGSVQAADDGRGTLLPGAAEGVGAVHGVRGGDGGWIGGRSHDNTTRAIGIGDMFLDNLGHGGRTVDVPNGLPVHGRPAELPGRGVTGTSGDKDGDAGPFSAPACPGHCGYFGGGKPPPPMVLPVRHAGYLAYIERKSPCHRTVHQGDGSEEKAVIRGGI